MISSVRRFPGQVALAAFVVYALTAGHAITIKSLPLAAQVAGWDWQPMNSQPLLWLLTLPMRLLPAGWVVMGLNLFSAAGAALTLGILARTLELASWDRPLPTLGKVWAKLPIVLACIVCGLEFNFWQEATAATGEMLQLGLFAAAILGLLEFQATRSRRWLEAAVFIWGLGMAENWMMLLTAPLFVVALFWIGRGEILQRTLLRRLLLAGGAGFSVWLLLPLWNSVAPHSPWSAGAAWLNALKNFKYFFVNLTAFWQGSRTATIAAVIFFLVPVLPAVIRMRDGGTRDKLVVDQFQVWLYRALRLALLLVCLWLALDPAVGPRQIFHKQAGLSLPFLSLDYLAALGAGFLAGNFLLAAYAKPRQSYRPPNFFEVAFERALRPGILVFLSVVALGLTIRNAAPIRQANRAPLDQFGQLALRELPARGGIVLSDDPQQLLAFQAAAAKAGTPGWLAVDLRLLPLPAYRAHLARQPAGHGRIKETAGPLKAAETIKLIAGWAQSAPVYYLHPVLGGLSEWFYFRPAGLAQELHAYPGNMIQPPPLTAELIAQNENFWNATAAQRQALQPTGSPANQREQGGRNTLYQRLQLEPVPAPQSQMLAGWYSAALDDWGVQLQRAGQLPAAKTRLEQALALNPQNISADVSLQSNTNLAAAGTGNLTGLAELAARAGGLQGMAQFLFRYGPVDEPAYCYLLGNACYQAGLPRQALQQFERAQALAPEAQAPRLALIRLYSRYGFNESARQLIHEVRGEGATQQDNLATEIELTLLEAGTWIRETNFAPARSLLAALSSRHPDNGRVTEAVTQADVALGDFTNALQVVNHQLASRPDDLPGLVREAGLYVRLGQAARALPVLDHALTLSNLPPIRLARAMARVEAGQYDAAEADYRDLENSTTNPLPVLVGLAEIASRRHDTNQAIALLERCVADLPPAAAQRDRLLARLNDLKKSRAGN